MGKSQSKPGSSWSWSYKRRENPEGDSYILRGCINARYRDSEEHLWSPEGSSDPLHHCKSSHGTMCGGSHEFDGRHAERPAGIPGELCSLKVPLPTEVTGSRCSLKVQAMQDSSSSPSKKLSPSSQDDGHAKTTIGAVDCDVSLDAEREMQEWAFTLYDFDGHRRITREDLSSILKSISEALAHSVILPPSGSRKLKLRLSVVSDQEAEARQNSTTSHAGRESHPGMPSHDNLSYGHSASTQSTSLPSVSPIKVAGTSHATASPLFGRQENKENALNRARDQATRAGIGIEVDLGGPGSSPHHHSPELLLPQHRHSFNVNHQCWRKDEKRTRRARHHHRRTQSMAPADLLPTNSTYPEQPSPDRQHRKARKSSSNPDPNKSGAPTTPKQTTNVGTNAVPVERAQENAERRSYYQELAGIDHQLTTTKPEEGSEGHEKDNEEEDELELPLGASATQTRLSQRQSRSSPSHHHRSSKSHEAQGAGGSGSGKKTKMQLNQELMGKYIYAQRHHRDYHMQLLEASRTRLEGLAPGLAPGLPSELPPGFNLQAVQEAKCSRHSFKRHSFPAGPVQVVTTQVVAPAPAVAPPTESSAAVQTPGVRGKHRRKSRRHHTLQPLTVMKHEIMERTEGVVYSPVTHKHQHHHHHEHHHHHHYHHYPDID